MGIKGKTNTEHEIEINYEDLEDIYLKTTSNNILLPGLCSAKDLVPEETASILEFDMIQSSPLADPIATTIDQGFITSTANWERGITRDICV